MCYGVYNQVPSILPYMRIYILVLSYFSSRIFYMALEFSYTISYQCSIKVKLLIGNPRAETRGISVYAYFMRAPEKAVPVERFP